jgi:NAD(P)H-hydrate repair Nnr-like enzyme with NAD(P)H-hydrate dehydratase domain
LTVVSFGHVASSDGRSWIDTGTATGLGTSGAGDVLAGAVGGAGARCHDAPQAACWATLCHRRAAARLSETFAPIGYLARQLADELPLALAELSAP